MSGLPLASANALALVSPTITPPINPGPAVAAMASQSESTSPAVARGSKLALVQANLVKDALAAQGTTAEIVIVKTTGDRILDRPLADAGGKGLFTKELEEALFAREADIAVHSMKDVPVVLPKGLA